MYIISMSEPEDSRGIEMVGNVNLSRVGRIVQLTRSSTG